MTSNLFGLVLGLANDNSIAFGCVRLARAMGAEVVLILARAASGIAEFGTLLATAQAKAPLQRLVTLEEIAQFSAFLCMAAASGMTGQTIYVDAGVHTL